MDQIEQRDNEVQIVRKGNIEQIGPKEQGQHKEGMDTKATKDTWNNSKKEAAKSKYKQKEHIEQSEYPEQREHKESMETKAQKAH